MSARWCRRSGCRRWAAISGGYAGGYSHFAVAASAPRRLARFIGLFKWKAFASLSRLHQARVKSGDRKRASANANRAELVHGLHEAARFDRRIVGSKVLMRGNWK